MLLSVFNRKGIVFIVFVYTQCLRVKIITFKQFSMDKDLFVFQNKEAFNFDPTRQPLFHVATDLFALQHGRRDYSQVFLVQGA